MKDKLEIIYYTKGKDIFTYYKIGDILIPYSVNVYTESQIKHDGKFTNKLDARYFTLIKQLQSGKKLSNFKVSKYFQYYVDRLREENPEYLI